LNACSFLGLSSVKIKSDDRYQIGQRILSDFLSCDQFYPMRDRRNCSAGYEYINIKFKLFTKTQNYNHEQNKLTVPPPLTPNQGLKRVHFGLCLASPLNFFFFLEGRGECLFHFTLSKIVVQVG